MWTPPSPPFVCTYGRPVPVYVCCVFDIKTTDTAPSQAKFSCAPHTRAQAHKLSHTVSFRAGAVLGEDLLLAAGQHGRL